MDGARRGIEIDFDVWKHIQVMRRTEQEDENGVLRRVLGLEDPLDGVEGGEEAAPGSWRWNGVELPAGTRIQLRFQELVVDGRVEGGRLVAPGAEGRPAVAERAPSTWMKAVVRRERGGPAAPGANGWEFIRVKVDGSWRELQALRRRRTGS